MSFPLSMNKIISLVIVALTAMLMAPESRAAVITAISQNVATAPQTFSTSTAFTVGYRFTPTVDLQVTALGYWVNPSTGLTVSHQVGIWTESNKVLQLSATVIPSDPQSGNGTYGFWAYNSTLTGATVLSAGTTYLIGGLIGSDLAPYSANGANITANPLAGIVTVTGFYNNGTGFNVTGANFQANYYSAPNFQFTVIPEPSSVLLILGTAGPLFLYGLSRRSKKS